MIIGTFLFYFVLLVFVFTSPGKLKQKETNLKKVLVLPAFFAIILAFLTVVKVFIIYKIIIVLVLGFTGFLTYWQYGERIKRWLD